MGSIWFSKKSFFYFGGLAVILIGGLVVISSPYHYINYSVGMEPRPWTMYDAAGYYPQVEIAISLRPSNTTVVLLDLVIHNNSTEENTCVNMTLGPENQVIGPDVTIYEYSEIIDLAPGNYTVYFEKVDGAGNIDLGLNQISDSRIWIVSGGMMNIIGIVMGIAGYLVPGSFLPSDSDTIVEWGYDKEEKDQ